MKIKTSYSNTPSWKEIYSLANLPEQMKPLEVLAHNLWWVWNDDALEIFAELDPVLWKKSGCNPVVLLQRLSLERVEEILKNKDLMSKIESVCLRFADYMSKTPDTSKTSVAYFSMEYGFTHILKIYSGGLGVLAGDYLKEASDSRVDLTGVGFLYKYGYFTQSISPEGQQVANYEPQIFGDLPIEQVYESDGTPMILTISYPERDIYAHVWKVNVGRVSLYLLDTDSDQNSEFDRSITHQLYGGDWENRLKQEYLLGLGGIQLLNKLGIKKEVYHCNEGHASFINLQRLLDLVEKEALTFNQALEVVKASGLYTVHTPVPAGHDYFEEDLLRKYMNPYPRRLGISWQDFMDMGRENPGTNEKFSMSTFALNTCQGANGVSLLHGRVSREMFQPVWKGYFAEELHVGHVTNGVHLPTWASKQSKGVFEKYFGKDFYEDQSNHKIWEAIYNVPDQEIWDMRVALKKRLFDYIGEQMRERWIDNQAEPNRILHVLEKINPKALLVGFGRRFATYKRAHLLFTDLDRLSRLVNNEERPIQFIFTGKAHPADGGGQGLIKQIIEISRRPEFLGKIIFLENYDMKLAKHLVAGVDIWLNTPTRPLEASGTSGEKAEMNGVLNFSVLDGWWYEGYREGAGWCLTDKRSYQNQEYQDQLDAATIYLTFEHQILPVYHAKNKAGYSEEWIKIIKKSIAEIAPEYTTKRMIDDYIEKFYRKQAKRSHLVNENNYAKAKEIAAWKEDMSSKWDSFVVVSVKKKTEIQDADRVIYHEGERFAAEIVIDKKDIKGDLGVECVLMKEKNGSLEYVTTYPFELVRKEGSKLYFEIDSKIMFVGAHKYALRVYPNNPDLPHRMDFAYVRWI